jgi:hypothetical protein
MNDNTYIDLMSAAITNTDGTETEALTMFELQLLERNDPRLVWELFEPVRLTLLRRLYGMARHQIEQPVSEAQPSIEEQQPLKAFGTAPETNDTADSSGTGQSSHSRPQRSAVSPFTTQRRVASARNRSPRSARSAQDVLMTIGGRKSHLDYLTNHRGMPIGDLTYMGLANSHDEAPMFQRFAQRLMDSGIPKTGRAGDVVRRFITPDEADRMWLDLMKEAAA